MTVDSLETRLDRLLKDIKDPNSLVPVEEVISHMEALRELLVHVDMLEDRHIEGIDGDELWILRAREIVADLLHDEA